MAKENNHRHRSHKEVGQCPYLAIVSIVAIVAAVFLVINFSGSFGSEDSGDTTLVVDEEGNLAGEATVDLYAKRIELQKYLKKSDLEGEVREILISELKNSLTYSLNSIDCHSTNNAFYGSSDNQYSCEERCQREGLVCLGAFGGTEDVAGSSTVEVNWASKIGLPISCSDVCYAGTNSILICQCI